MTWAEEVAVYRLLAAPGLGIAALGQVLEAWGEERELIDGFWGRPAREYRELWGLSERTARFLQAADGEERFAAARIEVARARAAEIELLTVMDPWYAALAEELGLPPLLFTRGNQDLLWAETVAIPHSADAPDEALSWGAALAGALSRAGIGLVSGHNRDGYRRVAAAAKREGAPLVIVLDRPLHGMPADGPLAEPVATARLWDERFRPERELIVSPFGPREVWLPRHARGRDALILGIATVVVAGGVRPDGTIASGCARRSAAGRPVFRSPFSRAPVHGTLLPPEIEAAAETIGATVNLLTPARDQAVGPASPHSRSRPGWLERRWAAEAAAFAEALRAMAGWQALVECCAAAATPERDPPFGWVPAVRPDWFEAGIAAMVYVPTGSHGREAQVIVVRWSSRSGSGDLALTAPPEATDALLLAPGEPIRDIEALQAYLARCRQRVEAALRIRPPSGRPAPDRSQLPDARPSPG